MSLLIPIFTPERTYHIARNFTATAVRAAEILPFQFRKTLVLTVLQNLLHQQLKEGDFDFLDHRVLHISITDISLDMYFSLEHGKLILLAYARPDVSIRGNMKEFLVLAARTQDPDTLFFQRRLLIEGDTDLGLEFKNSLDSIDYDQLPAVIRKSLQKLSVLSAD